MNGNISMKTADGKRFIISFGVKITHISTIKIKGPYFDVFKPSTTEVVFRSLSLLDSIPGIELLRYR